MKRRMSILLAALLVMTFSGMAQAQQHVSGQTQQNQGGGQGGMGGMHQGMGGMGGQGQGGQGTPGGKGEKHPMIHQAMHALRNAKQHLEKAEHDFGGHRVKAIEHTEAAIKELEEALQFDKK